MNQSEKEIHNPQRPNYAFDSDPTISLMDFREQTDALLLAQRAKFLIMIAVILVLLLPSLAWLIYENSVVNDKYRTLTISLEKHKRELETARSDIKNLRKSTSALLHEKIPGLFPFKYNSSYEINKKYVKRIAFDESSPKLGGFEAYQCRVSLHNQEDVTVLPEMVVVFFDRNGSVADYLHLGNVSDSTMKSGALKPNEKRTDISRAIEISDSAQKPMYFLVNVK